MAHPLGQIGQPSVQGDCLRLEPDVGSRWSFVRLRAMPGEGLVEMPLELGAMDSVTLVCELVACIELILDHQPEIGLDRTGSHLGQGKTLRRRFHELSHWVPDPMERSRAWLYTPEPRVRRCG